AALLGVALPAARADFQTERKKNWHQWRGPDANGVAPEADPPLEWSDTKNVRWKVEVPGRGSSSPIVWKDRIYLLTAIPTDRRVEEAPAGETPAAGSNAQEGGEQGRRGRGRGRGGSGRG